VPASHPVTISFIVPALNEEEVIERVVEDIIAVVKGRFADYELLLIDDGSTDRSGAIMENLARKYERIRALHNGRNLGLGASYQRGLAEARFEYVMLLCGDGGLPAKSLPVIFDEIGKADIVIPHMLNLREIKTPLRHLLSRTYTGLLNLLFGFKLKYYNGLPVHRTDLLRSIRITSRGFGFQAEILVKLLKSGCTYVEVGTFGAEETRRSLALRPRNVLSVAKTFFDLVIEIVKFKPLPRELVLKHGHSNDPPVRTGVMGGSR
jgi:glycosyltransferase involved in cell wall biosynthesis